jgi:hypothetical protein
MEAPKVGRDGPCKERITYHPGKLLVQGARYPPKGCCKIT